MRILFSGTGNYERPFPTAANESKHEIVFSEQILVTETSGLANDFDTISVFTSDKVNAAVLFFLHIALLFLMALPRQLPAQVSNNALRLALQKLYTSSAQTKYLGAAKTFYELTDYKYRWLKNDLGTLHELTGLMGKLPETGLSLLDYTMSLPTDMHNESDSAETEIGLTLMSLNVIHDLWYGRSAAPVSYDGLKSAQDIDSTPSMLSRYLQTGKMTDILRDFEPSTKEYLALRDYLQVLQNTASQQGFADMIIKGVKTKQDSIRFWNRLQQLGIHNYDPQHLLPATFHDAVKRTQALFALSSNGDMDVYTMNALNEPIVERIRDIAESMNALRWIYRRFSSGKGVIVNIPSAELFYYENGSVSFASRIIAGKVSTPTPTLGSIIDEVILYPYWHVPYSIATRELLPLIKKDPDFINAGSYQLLDNKGRVVNPSSVNWSSITARNFPYTLRQSTGCDNALGWIKLNFNSPYGVYLHDTPGKPLFNFKRRFFSHGCMRLEKASELARKIIPGKTQFIDSVENLGPLKNQDPIGIRVPAPVPVAVIYQRAWFDSEGNMRFYEDIYKRKNTRSTK